MLSSADRDVCERDPALPGLPLMLDPSALGRALGLSDLDHAYLRYKPATSCAAGLLHPECGALAAYACTHDRYVEVSQRPEWRAGTDVVMLDDACVAVIPARLDRELKALRRFLDERRRGKFLRSLIGKRSGVFEGDYNILRYKPGRRLVALVGTAGHTRAALKVTAAADFNQALIGAVGAAALGGAPLLGSDASRNALVTGWIEGEPLCPVSAGRPSGRSAVEETGAALARLHSATFRPAAKISRTHVVRTLAQVEPALAMLDASLGAEAGRIAEEVLRRLAQSNPARKLVHGDFSADQVVHSGERPVILDWDHAARGDPAGDFGTFLARLDAQIADGALAPAEAEAMAAALADGYGAVAGRLPDGIAIQHARALLLLATEGFRIRHPDWPGRTAALLERAATLVARRHRAGLDAAMPALDAALDRDAVRAGLAAALGRRSSAVRIETPQLLRHKAGRRALVRYDLVDDGGTAKVLLGKLRAKGLDRRTPAIHDALRAEGFDGSGQPAVGVPRVAGTIDHLGLWLQDLVPGVCLGKLMDPKAEPEPFARTGAALAALHRRDPAGERRWSFADELAVLDRALARAAGARSDLAPALRAISSFAADRLATVGEGAACGIHRDFYFDQVIVDEDRIWLVDLDLYALGDPAIDVGNFLAHLDELGLRRHADPRAFARQEAAFREGYGTAPGAADADRVAALRAVSLARHVDLAMRLRGRGHTIEAVLALAAADLGASERCRT